MKGRSKHKKKNTFKFQPFSERVASLNINVYHRIGINRKQVPEDEDTFFYEVLLKWSDLNCTEGYGNFQKELGKDIQSLPQLVHKKDSVVQLLLSYIRKKDALYLQPVLELVVALARDLQVDFCPYFPEFFKEIVALLCTKDVDQLEWSFSCLAYLYKFMWRYLTRDMESAYSLYSTLLCSYQDKHIRDFAAESFAFLSRKAPDKKAFFHMIFQQLETDPNKVEGLGQLLFEIVKGVKKKLHSCTENILPMILDSLNDTRFSQKYVAETLTYMFKSLAEHIVADNCEIIWNILWASVFAVQKKTKDSQHHEVALCYLLKLVIQLLKHKTGILVSSTSQTVKNVTELLTLELSDNIQRRVLKITSSLLVYRNLSLPLESVSHLIQLAFRCSASPNIVFLFVHRLFKFAHFETHVLPHFLQYTHQCINDDGSDAVVKDVLRIMTELLLHKSPLMQSGMNLDDWKEYPLEFSYIIRQCSKGEEKNVTTMPSVLEKNLLPKKLEDFENNYIFYIYTLVCLPHVKPLKFEAVHEKLKKIITVVMDNLIRLNKSKQTSSGELREIPTECKVENVNTNGKEVDEIYDESEKSNEQQTLKDSFAVDHHKQQLLFLLNIAMETFIHIADPDVVTADFSIDHILEVCLTGSDVIHNVHSLRMLDLYLSVLLISKKESLLTSELQERLYASLSNNLFSPYSQVRLLTLHMLSVFNPPLPVHPDGLSMDQVFKICLAAELVPVTLFEYREKLKILQKLEFGLVQCSLPLGGKFDMVPLQYLVGMFHINFQLLWNPIMKLIESHAHGIRADQFWSIYLPILKMAALLNQSDKFMQLTCSYNAYIESEESVINNMEKKLCNITESPKAFSFRNLLWKVMIQFSDVCESKSQELILLYLEFLRKEYYCVDAEVAPCVNLKYAIEEEESETTDMNQITETQEESVMEIDDLEIKGDEAEEDGEKSLSSAAPDEIIIKKRMKSSTIRALCAHLEVFSNLRNLEKVDLELELKASLLRFLTHTYKELQHAALNCLLSFGYSCLSPYRSNLHGLLDDKTFRLELFHLSEKNECELVSPEHRAVLMPILLRILYGKLKQKPRGKKHRRHHTDEHHIVIFRYLASAGEKELQAFLALAFDTFGRYIESKDNILEVVTQIMSVLDLSAAIPLRQLDEALNFLDVIFKYITKFMSDITTQLLRFLLCIGAMIATILDQRTNLKKGYLGSLKKLRNEVINRVRQFFTKFENYKWTEVELEAVFKVAVWPQLERLTQEGIYSPTALLQLLCEWSKNPRYFCLLSKHAPNNEFITPIPYVMKLLNGDYIHSSVCNAILEMVENLITHEDFIPDEENLEEEDGIHYTPLPCRDLLQVRTDCKEWETKPSFGTLLLLPYKDHLIQHLKKKIASSNKHNSDRDSRILSWVSEFMTDANLSGELVQLIVTVLIKKSKGTGKEAYVTKMLTTLANLMGNIESPGEYVQTLSPLYSTIEGRIGRTAVCEVMESIALKDKEKEDIVKLICDLNSWSDKSMDDPDYTRRLNAFEVLNEKLSSGDLNTELALLIIYNCCFLIRTTEDLSLSDSATHCLQNLAPALATFQEENRGEFCMILDVVLLPQIWRGIGMKKEKVRHEFLSILGALVSSCSEYHQLLKDLSKLIDPKKEEMNFFANLRHIQLYRRAKALIRLNRDLTENPGFLQPRTLSRFILPIVSHFLFTDLYKEHNSLVDIAIEIVGSSCRSMPWPQYVKILQVYLKCMTQRKDYQKQAIKIVVCILDAFHFDISLSEDLPTNLTQQQCVEKINEVSETKELNDTQNTTGDLGEMLTSIADDEDDEMQISKNQNKENSQLNALTVAKATNIHRHISVRLLPRLNKYLNHKTKRNEAHKMNKKYYPEDEDMLRIPLALAIVKLLKNLPSGILEENLPGIFLTMCNFLNSRSEDLRDAARKILMKIMVTVGPKYLFLFLSQMKSILKKGYQIHIMIHTVQFILNGMTEHLKPGDTDEIIDIVFEVCEMELFGSASEEKEVEKITFKVKEARGVHSYATFNILARFISEKLLTNLIMPLKEILSTTHSHKIVKKVSECLRHVVLGLASNNDLTAASQFIFIYGIVSQSIPNISQSIKPDVLPRPDPRLQPESTFIIAPEPKRTGAVPKTSRKTNDHVLIEFGFQLLYFLLKRRKLQPSKLEQLQMLDPFVPIMVKCLSSQHTKIIMLSLQCFIPIFKLKLPSLQQNMKTVTASIFSLLNKYAATGMAKGDNSFMVQVAFKAVTVIVKDVDYHTIDTDQLRVLLNYAEQDIYDYTRQATAFTLLQAIISQKLVVPEMCDVMHKVSDLSITADALYVRDKARQVFFQFIMDYPLGSKLQQYLQFYLSQLSYQKECGRESAIEMLHRIFTSFPEHLLKTYSALFFINMTSRFVNDDSPNCRKMIGLSLKALLQRLEPEQRYQLFDMTMLWLQDRKVKVRRLAAQVCGLFVEVEQESFQHRLSALLPIVAIHLSPDYYQPGGPKTSVEENSKKEASDSDGKNKKEDVKEEEKCWDHFLFHLLLLLLKILQHCPVVLHREQYKEDMNDIWEHVHTHLLHPHTWVRLTASRLFGHLFGKYSAADFVAVSSKEAPAEYLLQDTKKKLRSLVLDFCAQLHAKDIEEELGEQAIKNLVFLAKVIIHIEDAEQNVNDSAHNAESEDKESADDQKELLDKHTVTFYWMIKRLRREINDEIVKTPQCVTKRSLIFKWIAAVTLEQQKEKLTDVLEMLLSPLVRELCNVNIKPEFKNLTQEVADLVRDKVGVKCYTQYFAQIQSYLTEKRNKRKVISAQKVISNPVIAAKRKISKNVSKMKAKKRKASEKTGKKAKKLKLKDLAIWK